MYVESTAHDAARSGEDQRVFLHGVTWDQFEAVVAMRGDCASPRFTYVDGELELMSPSRAHEGIAALIGRLIEAYADHRGLDWNAFGSWLLEDPVSRQGVEPDGCWVIGGPGDRPDLVLEVVWTSGGLSKLEIYRDLGVREVWFWRRKSTRIEIFELVEGSYRPRRDSVVVPGLDPRRLEDFLDHEHQSRAIRAFRASLASDAPRTEG